MSQLKDSLQDLETKPISHVAITTVKIQSSDFDIELYVASLRRSGMTTPELLAQEYGRLELSISKLEESNAILAEEGDDPEFQLAIDENRHVIAKQRSMLAKLAELLGQDPGIYI